MDIAEILAYIIYNPIWLSRYRTFPSLLDQVITTRYQLATFQESPLCLPILALYAGIVVLVKYFSIMRTFPRIETATSRRRGIPLNHSFADPSNSASE